MDDLLRRITNSHTALQTMHITAEKANLAILLDTLGTLEECHAFVSEQKTKAKEGETNNA